MELILVVIYVVIAWYFMSFFQNNMGIVFFGNLSDYFIKKLVFALIFGWAIIPIGLICLLFKRLFTTKG